MTLIYNFKAVLKKAWSVRLMALAALLSGAEVILPMITDSLPWPRWASALLTMAVVGGALVARIVVQPKSLP